MKVCVYPTNMPWSKIKSFHKMGKIFAYYVSNGNIKRTPFKLSQEIDFKK